MYVVIDGFNYVTAIKSKVILVKKTQLFLGSKSVGKRQIKSWPSTHCMHNKYRSQLIPLLVFSCDQQLMFSGVYLHTQ